MNEGEPTISLVIPDSVLEQWQRMVDLMAKLVGVPVGRIMRIGGPDIEVFVSSRSHGNPYKPGDKAHLLGSGLYCETVLKTRAKLLVPNARSDEKWRNSPDIKLNMVSYLGFPILLPDGRPFGTICVLDTKENRYSELYEELMLHFREVVQGHLEPLFVNWSLRDRISG